LSEGEGEARYTRIPTLDDTCYINEVLKQIKVKHHNLFPKKINLQRIIVTNHNFS